ncbi:MAG: hypothetical protein FWE42_02035 [Defluviitaleaceae bacterium]|nr:hypothetical protein [Defluviitaleaceae bacterium]
MTQKEFLRDLRRGLGSAVIEIEATHNPCQYKDIVLRCCLKDIGYDPQSEGTKGNYLYSAICALGAKDDFEGTIIDAFTKRLEHHLFQQLCDILCNYMYDGSGKARAALKTKYQSLYNQLLRQRSFPFKYCEREQFEYLMICAVDAGKWAAFKGCAADVGSIILKRKDDACSAYDWFYGHCENLFGEGRIAKYLSEASQKSEEIKAFADAVNSLEKTRKANASQRAELNVTLESYIAQAMEYDKESRTRMNMIAMRFSRQGTEEDFVELASIITAAQSDEERAKMLRVFRYRDFPGDISGLLEYAESGCEQLQNNALSALERIKDHRVHDLAIKFIAAGNIDAGLPLLKENWCKQDEPLIRRQILSSRKVTHETQMNIQSIYTKHRSKNCGDILEHVYRNGPCGFCRWGIVESMWKSRVLSEKILEECLHDSYDETRKFARKIIKRK